MARFRPVSGSPRDKGRQATRVRSKRAPLLDDIGQDPWSLPTVSRRDSVRSPAIKLSSPVGTIVKQEVEEDEVAAPIPIGAAVEDPRGTPLGKIITADGKEQPYYHEIPGFVYQPIPGFEHCFKAPKPAPTLKPQDTKAPSKSVLSQQQAANEKPPVRSIALRKGTALRRKSTVHEPPARKTSKRSRSYATPDSVGSEDKSVAFVDADSDSNEGDKAGKIKLRPSRTFYIGDFNEVKKCLLLQFRDLHLKTVRSIVTAWIKYREPRRRHLYGGYHKKLPTEVLPECSPPWWPEDVQVNEPSHLSRDHVLSLAVDFLLVHREIDQMKRKTSWVQTLRKLAMCTVELVPEDSFSSSKSPVYDKEMRERVTNHILPSLFDLAQSYEDHVIQYSLFEELNPTDPGTGREHTWQPMPKPFRRSRRSRQVRKRKTVEVVVKVEEEDTEAWGDETEPDNALTNAFLSRKRVKATEGADRQEVNGADTAVLPATSTPEPTAPQLLEPEQPQSSADMSFDDPMDYLVFGDGMDLDVKSDSFTSYNNLDSLCSMYPTSQPMQYPISQPTFDHQSFLSQDSMTSFSQSFATPATSSLVNPFQTYNAPFQPQLHQSALRSATLPRSGNFPRQYEHAFRLHPAVGVGSESFHGLPMDSNYSNHTHRIE